MSCPTRRDFLKSSVTAAFAAGIGGGLARNLIAAPVPAASSVTKAALFPAELSIKKGLVYDMLPAKLSHSERFKTARDAGFEVVQAPTTPDEREAEEIKKAAVAANLRI